MPICLCRTAAVRFESERQVIRSNVERVEMAVESALFDCVGHNFHNLSVMPELEGTRGPAPDRRPTRNEASDSQTA